jgi:hypothetical protein
VLFDDKIFLVELEKARWIAFPVTLGMVAEAVEGVLRPAAGGHAAALLQGVTNVTLAAFDRYPVPAALGAEAWAAARAALARDLSLIGLHAVKRVMDVPARFVDRYLTAMPIHEKLRAKDDLAIHNFLKTNLCNVHDVFVQRADVAALAKALALP